MRAFPPYQSGRAFWSLREARLVGQLPLAPGGGLGFSEVPLSMAMAAGLKEKIEKVRAGGPSKENIMGAVEALLLKTKDYQHEIDRLHVFLEAVDFKLPPEWKKRETLLTLAYNAGLIKDVALYRRNLRVDTEPPASTLLLDGLRSLKGDALFLKEIDQFLNNPTEQSAALLAQVANIKLKGQGKAEQIVLPQRQKAIWLLSLLEQAKIEGVKDQAYLRAREKLFGTARPWPADSAPPRLEAAPTGPSIDYNTRVRIVNGGMLYAVGSGRRGGIAIDQVAKELETFTDIFAVGTVYGAIWERLSQIGRQMYKCGKYVIIHSNACEWNRLVRAGQLLEDILLAEGRLEEPYLAMVLSTANEVHAPRPAAFFAETALKMRARFKFVEEGTVMHGIGRDERGRYVEAKRLVHQSGPRELLDEFIEERQTPLEVTKARDRRERAKRIMEERQAWHRRYKELMPGGAMSGGVMGGRAPRWHLDELNRQLEKEGVPLTGNEWKSLSYGRRMRAKDPNAQVSWNNVPVNYDGTLGSSVLKNRKEYRPPQLPENKPQMEYRVRLQEFQGRFQSLRGMIAGIPDASLQVWYAQFLDTLAAWLQPTMSKTVASYDRSDYASRVQNALERWRTIRSWIAQKYPDRIPQLETEEMKLGIPSVANVAQDPRQTERGGSRAAEQQRRLDVLKESFRGEPIYEEIIGVDNRDLQAECITVLVPHPFKPGQTLSVLYYPHRADPLWNQDEGFTALETYGIVPEKVYWSGGSKVAAVRFKFYKEGAFTVGKRSVVVAKKPEPIAVPKIVLSPRPTEPHADGEGPKEVARATQALEEILAAAEARTGPPPSVFRVEEMERIAGELKKIEKGLPYMKLPAFLEITDRIKELMLEKPKMGTPEQVAQSEIDRLIRAILHKKTSKTP